MIIEVIQPCFGYLKEDPTQVRYNYEFEKGVHTFAGGETKDWKMIIVQTYNSNHGLPEPKEGEILFKYKWNRGYLLKESFKI